MLVSTQNRLGAKVTMESETPCSVETLESMSLVSNPSREMLSEKAASGFLIPLKSESIQIKPYIKPLP